MPEPYKQFIEQLQGRLEEIERLTNDDEDRLTILDGVWQIGKAADAYTREIGAALVEIAMDAGMPAGSLQKYVRFYRFYSNGYRSEINGRPLSWSHYAAILYVAESRARDFYLEEAALQGWSSHELRRRIRNNYYEERMNAKTAARVSENTLKEINQRLFTYAARVAKVVDGDTLELDIDVGFKTSTRQKVRLRGINCPEAKTKKGEAAKAFVLQELLGAAPTDEEDGEAKEEEDRSAGPDLSAGPMVIIRTYKTEKYGRYLADLWYLKGETDREVILAKGKFLNQVLLDAGHAVKV